jgi:signal transduction histidine kinase
MGAVGTLATGVDHNFNNPLTGIMGFRSLVLADLLPENPHFRHLEKIQEFLNC